MQMRVGPKNLLSVLVCYILALLLKSVWLQKKNNALGLN